LSPIARPIAGVAASTARALQAVEHRSRRWHLPLG
jgi:hypothetical protein